jgi:hypothetical protein
MEHEGLLRCSQEPATGPYPKIIPINILPSNILNIHFNIIPPFTFMLFKVVYYLRVSQQKYEHNSHTCYVPSPSHHWFHRPYNVRRRVQTRNAAGEDTQHHEVSTQSSRTETHCITVYKTLTQIINACYRNTDMWRGYTSYIRRKKASTAVSTE